MYHRLQTGSQSSITLFLCGDVMTGRGIDQILPHPSQPRLFEPYMRSAREYVELAEHAVGELSKPVDFAYIWGDALVELERMQPAARIVNLETSVTASENAWPGKGIHYRMHPANVPCLTAAGLDCCVLANNHVMDWGRSGLEETLNILHGADLATAGAGFNEEEAANPARIQLEGGNRVLVFGCAMLNCGVPPQWAATKYRSGVNIIFDPVLPAADAIARRVRPEKRPGDIVVLSIHWGVNWDFEISADERAFAHHVIDAAGVDVVHGHSSHHVKGIEVYRERPIIYGCGDFINDYEGIGGYEDYRADLSLMYFLTLDASTGRLRQFALTPMQIKFFRVNRAPKEGVRWLHDTLSRESDQLGMRVQREADDTLLLRWS